MELCSNGHGEICYEERNCPACEVIEEKQKDIDLLEDQIADLKENIIKDLQYKLEQATEGLLLLKGDE